MDEEGTLKPHFYLLFLVLILRSYGLKVNRGVLISKSEMTKKKLNKNSALLL